MVVVGEGRCWLAIGWKKDEVRMSEVKKIQTATRALDAMSRTKVWTKMEKMTS